MSECRIDQLGCVLHGFRDSECRFFNYQHEPPAPRAGERDASKWHADSSGGWGYVWQGGACLAKCPEPSRAQQIITEHNQHATLIEQRDCALAALKGVAIMLNTNLSSYDDEPWAQRVRTAIAAIEQEGEA